MPRRPVRDDLCKPNVLQVAPEYAAVCAGLGDIGYHGMFMTKNFGIRQALGILVTEMEIEPGPLGKPEVCDHCMECVNACPLGAISRDKTHEVRCNDTIRSFGVVNALACESCPNGIANDDESFAGVETLSLTGTDDTAAEQAGRLPCRLSAACGRACIAHVEKTHITGYHIPFRAREPWGIRPDKKRSGRRC